MTLPIDIDDLLSVIVLGSVNAQVSPGKVTITGHDRNKDWDIQKAKGTTGANAKLNGDPIVPFTCTFELAGDGDEETDDFDRWDDFQRLIESTTNGPNPIALPIYHPDLARQRITEVTNAGVGGLKHDGLGGATVEVKFLPFRPSKPKPVTKATAAPASKTATSKNPTQQNDPNAAAKRELASLLDEAKKP